MNQTIDNDIVATKEFHQRVSSLYKLGGRNRNIFAKVQSLLGGIKEEGEKAFNQFSVTNHGESRIKSCVKYDLGQGFRLVTVKRDRIIWMLYVGDHEDTDKWITRNSGWTPVRASDGSIRTVRKSAILKSTIWEGPLFPDQRSLLRDLKTKVIMKNFWVY